MYRACRFVCVENLLGLAALLLDILSTGHESVIPTRRKHNIILSGASGCIRGCGIFFETVAASRCSAHLTKKNTSDSRLLRAEPFEQRGHDRADLAAQRKVSKPIEPGLLAVDDHQRRAVLLCQHREARGRKYLQR